MRTLKSRRIQEAVCVRVKGGGREEIHTRFWFESAEKRTLLKGREAGARVS
jgi:hypothetical protein